MPYSRAWRRIQRSDLIDKGVLGLGRGGDRAEGAGNGRPTVETPLQLVYFPACTRKYVKFFTRPPLGSEAATGVNRGPLPRASAADAAATYAATIRSAPPADRVGDSQRDHH